MIADCKYTVCLYQGAGAMLVPLEVEADSEEEAKEFLGGVRK